MLEAKHFTTEHLIRNSCERACLDRLLELAEYLSLQEKVMITMRFRDGYNYSDIACLLGIHPANVGRRIKTICKKVEKLYESRII